MNFRKIFQIDFQHFGWARRASLLVLKGPTIAAEGCSPQQELEKAGRRAAIFLVVLKALQCHLNVGKSKMRILLLLLKRSLSLIGILN